MAFLRGLLSTLALTLALTTTAAQADGTFAQLDVGGGTATAVLARSAGPWSYGIAGTQHADGASVGASALYTLGTPAGVSIKAGPSLGWVDDDTSASWEAGAKLSLDRWTPTSWGGLYTLGEVNSIDSGWFVAAQANHTASGWGLELSRGGSDSYQETTLAVRKRIGEGPFNVRFGRKFDSDAYFVGVVFNSF